MLRKMQSELPQSAWTWCTKLLGKTVSKDATVNGCNVSKFDKKSGTINEKMLNGLNVFGVLYR